MTKLTFAKKNCYSTCSKEKLTAGEKYFRQSTTKYIHGQKVLNVQFDSIRRVSCIVLMLLIDCHTDKTKEWMN